MPQRSKCDVSWIIRSLFSNLFVETLVDKTLLTHLLCLWSHEVVIYSLRILYEYSRSFSRLIQCDRGLKLWNSSKINRFQQWYGISNYQGCKIDCKRRIAISQLTQFDRNQRNLISSKDGICVKCMVKIDSSLEITWVDYGTMYNGSDIREILKPCLTVIFIKIRIIVADIWRHLVIQ